MHATIFSTNLNYSKVKSKAVKSLLNIFSVFLLLLITSNLGAQSPDSDIVHIVKKGENLFRISKSYDTTVERLQVLNKLTSSSKIYVDQELLIEKGTGGNMEGNSARYRDPGEDLLTFYAWEDRSLASERGERKSTSHLRQGNAGNGRERGAVASNYVGNSPSRSRDLGNDRQSLIDYTYAYGFDRYNWTDSESYIVGEVDREVLDVIDKLDELRSSATYDRNGRRIISTQKVPQRSNYARMTYRGSHGGRSSTFRRGEGAIDNPYYKERVRRKLAGTIYYYRVKKGDSLLSIALAHNSSTEEIIEKNELKDYDLLVGSTLKIVQRE